MASAEGSVSMASAEGSASMASAEGSASRASAEGSASMASAEGSASMASAEGSASRASAEGSTSRALTAGPSHSLRRFVPLVGMPCAGKHRERPVVDNRPADRRPSRNLRPCANLQAVKTDGQMRGEYSSSCSENTMLDRVCTTNTQVHARNGTPDLQPSLLRSSGHGCTEASHVGAYRKRSALVAAYILIAPCPS
eukprot:scaffold19400_cov63-Phaeocystis_antarctica.AAC.1